MVIGVMNECYGFKYPCFSEENSTQLSSVLAHVTGNIQPSRDHFESCTLLLMHNLAQPTWVLIKCNKKILSHIVCVNGKNNVQSTFGIVQGKVCHQDQILFEESCFLFLWFEENSFPSHQLDNICNLKGKQTNGKLAPDASVFLSLIFATNLPFLKAIHIIESKGTLKLSFVIYRSVWMKIDQQQNQERNGFLLCKSNKHEHSTKTNLLLICDMEIYVSAVHNNLQTSPCSLQDFKNELNQTILNRAYNNCKAFFFKSRSGECFPFRFLTNQVKNTKHKHDVFTCNNGLKIPPTKVNDLVSDCGPTEEDELQYIQLLKHGIYHKCKEPGQLPCILGHTKCYKINEICIYRLDQYGHLTPCRIGSHIEKCSNFSCSKHFKCPNYYCIPWGYLCNGKWDCPDGFDEHSISCERRNCTRMFKCKTSSMCIHLDDVCDGYTDCLLGDDENLCDLAGIQCKFQCHCLFYALFCKDTSVSFFDKADLPYVSVCINFCNLSNPIAFHIFPHAAFLDFSHNSIVEFCHLVWKSSYLLSLDFSHNKIKSIQRHCFDHQINLKYIILNNNQIYSLHGNSFFGLATVFLINLANNKLKAFSANIFAKNLHVYVLDIYSNPFGSSKSYILAFESISIEILHSEHDRLCCITPVKLRCLSPSLDKHSCLSLLPNTIIQAFTVVLFVVIFVFNFSAIVMHSSDNTVSKNRTQKPVKILVLSISLAHCLHGTYLAILWIGNFLNSKNFAAQEEEWRNNFMCVIAFSANLLYCILLPLQMILLSFARLWLVCKPFSLKFKSPNYVLKLSLLLFIVSSLLSGVYVAHNFLFNHVASALCSAFVEEYSQKSGNTLTVITAGLALQLLTIAFITFSGIIIIRGIKESEQAAGHIINISITFYKQLLLLLLSCILSWIPESIVFLNFIVAPDTYSREITIWTIILGMSLKSVTDPLLFTCFVHKKPKQNEKASKW